MSADHKKLANSLRARKSHVTTRGKHLQESLDVLTNGSPAILCSRLKESLSRFEGAVKGVEETYLLLEEQVIFLRGQQAETLSLNSSSLPPILEETTN